jgi:hypothetical protein
MRSLWAAQAYTLGAASRPDFGVVSVLRGIDMQMTGAMPIRFRNRENKKVFIVEILTKTGRAAQSESELRSFCFVDRIK